MTENHPITPPPELVEQWMQDHSTKYALSRQAAQWGADCELEKCCEVLDEHNPSAYWGELLRSRRRPKPPSLKEQALKELAWVDEHLDMPLHNHCNAVHTIRRALEQLDD
jgi:hypothetical protein